MKCRKCGSWSVPRDGACKRCGHVPYARKAYTSADEIIKDYLLPLKVDEPKSVNEIATDILKKVQEKV